MRKLKDSDNYAPLRALEIADLKLLICYLLKSINEPIDKEKLVERIIATDIAEYFDTRQAISELVSNGNITENEEGMIAVSDTGREAATVLESSIPLSLREKVVEESVKILTRSRREKENDVFIEKTENGCNVKCVIKDRESVLMSFTLLVADELQAEMIKEKFLSDPANVYKTLIYSLLADKKD